MVEDGQVYILTVHTNNTSVVAPFSLLGLCEAFSDDVQEKHWIFMSSLCFQKYLSVNIKLMKELRVPL